MPTGTPIATLLLESSSPPLPLPVLSVPPLPLPLVLLASPPAPVSTLRVPPAYMLVLGPFAARFGEPGTSSGPSAVGSESSWIWSRDRVNSGSPDTLEFLPVYTNDVGCEPPPVTVTFASVRLPHDTYMCVSSCAK